MKENELLNQLEESYESFLIPLRMGDGLKEIPFKRFCELLKYGSEFWGEVDTIPKRAVNIFIDAFSAMTASSYLYDAVEKNKIDMAADEMNDFIRDCVHKN